MKSLLRHESAGRIGDRRWRFCASPDCDVVYHSEDGHCAFRKRDLTVKVHQKEPGDPEVPVCFCFHHSPATIAEEIERTGRSTAVERIQRQIRDEGCLCERLNPQGSCCLGNVRGVVRQLLDAVIS